MCSSDRNNMPHFLETTHVVVAPRTQVELLGPALLRIQPAEDQHHIGCEPDVLFRSQQHAPCPGNDACCCCAAHPGGVAWSSPSPHPAGRRSASYRMRTGCALPIATTCPMSWKRRMLLLRRAPRWSCLVQPFSASSRPKISII